ncbi:hypothetical protein [Bosea sp. UC22_33]|uniref:hypothetical protein n=1 Tax=Bosea sp. UC22_33 TaxID=3350165 RepID=UPI0036714C9B
MDTFVADTRGMAKNACSDCVSHACNCPRAASSLAARAADTSDHLAGFTRPTNPEIRLLSPHPIWKPILYQIKASTRSGKVANRAFSASEALRLLRETQAQPFLRSCIVLRQGVIISQVELEQAARKELD